MFADIERGREWRRDYEKRRYAQRMSEIIAHLGGVCVICGTSSNLEVHHKIPKEKEFTLSERYGHPWLVLVEELKKCELRCKEHHKEAHTSKHGTISCYRGHRCRCDECVKVWREACKRWSATSRKKRRSSSGTEGSFSS